jgi:hypothetical protein
MPPGVSALTTSLDYPRRVLLRTTVAAIAFAAALAAPAAAAEISLSVGSDAGVRLGQPTELTGKVTENGAALAGLTVALELRKHPYKGGWRRAGDTDVTAADGSFSFERDLDRNHQARVRLVDVAPTVYSAPREAYVLPAIRPSYRQRSRRRLRLRLEYTVPRDVELSAPTRFYVGPCERDRRGRCTARLARFRVEAETLRVRKGRYSATVRMRLPKSFGGQFQFVGCFVYSPGSGMGDPGQRCPRRYARLR